MATNVTLATIVDEAHRIVRVSIQKDVSPELHKPEIWIQIEIITLRREDENSKIKRIRLRMNEFEKLYKHIKEEMD